MVLNRNSTCLPSLALWLNSGVEVPSTIDFIKAQYAFELPTNQIWKRDYDLFSIDEQFHVIEKAKEQYVRRIISEISFPLLETISFGVANSVTLLDGVADTGVIDLADVQLATYLAEKRPGGLPYFRHGKYSLVAFPPGCRGLRCMSRYEGGLSMDSVTDWVATSILSLPRIRYYSKESMAQNFLLKSKPHKVQLLTAFPTTGHHNAIIKGHNHVLYLGKVKVILFSQTGERATPFIRQAAKNYSAYAAFAFVLWQEGESSLWWNMLGVESAPAIVFLKETGVKPVVHHGYVNS
ncbi:hypothetical protein K7X08_024354 [Anisodus acutangulus]|uniref:Uncharacterized protein n=1 Tax=Anisodus acutangulus TaxID=402998 RepID=A0A9Q1MAY6_9SOLA|nr:hypothetical protein K7X08_024354 [Anisodus acutangulus]